MFQTKSKMFAIFAGTSASIFHGNKREKTCVFPLILPFEVNYGIRLSCNRCGASKPLKRKAPTAGGGVVGFHQVDGVAGKLK